MSNLSVKMCWENTAEGKNTKICYYLPGGTSSRWGSVYVTVYDTVECRNKSDRVNELLTITKNQKQKQTHLGYLNYYQFKVINITN